MESIYYLYQQRLEKRIEILKQLFVSAILFLCIAFVVWVAYKFESEKDINAKKVINFEIRLIMLEESFKEFKEIKDD